MTKPASPPDHAMGARIVALETDSPLRRFGVQVGVHLLSINGEEVRDALDLAYLEADEEMEIEILSSAPGSGKVRTLSFEKSFDMPLGVELEAFAPMRCANRCVFCFIDQNPQGLRETLYVKDEDYRLSFACGHYITASSLKEEDLERIEQFRFSPLYISVHATDPEVRARLLGRHHPVPILPLLKRLKKAHVDYHTQIVLVPGWNDGEVLDQTLNELRSLGDALLSVAVVPVGLTDHRAGLENLRLFSPEEARALISQIERHQESFRQDGGERVVLLADECYLLAGVEPPEYSEEEREYQYENGVGMVDALRRLWAESRRDWPEALPAPIRLVVLTARLGASVLRPLLAEMCEAVRGLNGEVVEIDNTLFGENVTVSGLLGGRDFDRALEGLEKEVSPPDLALIPRNALREEGDRFLDDLPLETLRKRHPAVRIEAVEGDPEAILESIQETSQEKARS